MTRRASGAGTWLAWRWDIVWLGRLAGAFVIASAVGLAIWMTVTSEDASGPFDQRFFRFWYMFVTIGWGGVPIILLAELANRLTGHRPPDGG